MVTAYFIDEDFLKEYTPIAGNVDVTLLKPFFYQAQERYVRHLLGDALTERLMTGINAANLSDEEKVLLENLQFALAWYVMYDAFPFLADKIKNIGVVNTADDKQTRIDDGRLNMNMRVALNTAEYWSERAAAYIRNNRSAFPDYNWGQLDVNPQAGANFFSPIHFRKGINIQGNHVDTNWIRQYYENKGYDY
jgi:hypothetical protein